MEMSVPALLEAEHRSGEDPCRWSKTLTFAPQRGFRQPSVGPEHIEIPPGGSCSHRLFPDAVDRTRVAGPASPGGSSSPRIVSAEIPLVLCPRLSRRE